MRAWLFFIALASALATLVAASLESKGYDLLFMYHVYKLDFQYNGKNRQMAVGGSGSGPNGLMNLREFTEFVIMPQKRRFYNPGNSHDTFDPDISLGHPLNIGATGYSGALEASVLHNGVGNAPNFPAILEAVGKIWTSLPEPQDLDGVLEWTKISEINRHQTSARLRDQEVGTLKNLNAMLQADVNFGPPSTVLHMSPDGRSYDAYDHDTTLLHALNDPANSAIQAQIRTDLANYEQYVQGTSEYTRHLAVLDKLGEIVDNLCY